MPPREWWTPERREVQRQRLLQARIWERSTGPRTPEGKAKVSRNAYKPDSLNRSIRELNQQVRQLLREQKEVIQWIDD